MSDVVRRIADAVLYEGYLLWPYRRSAAKNQQRWNFGCIMPPVWSAAHPEETAEAGIQLLVEGAEPTIDVTLRFLHVVRRQLFDLSGRAVDSLGHGADQQISWEEATEREITASGPFSVVAGKRSEATDNGRIEHSWHTVLGAVSCRAEPLDNGVRRVTITVANVTPFAGPHLPEGSNPTTGTLRARALNHALCSAHLIVTVRDGAFISPLDPAAAAQCTQQRMWPVLVGDAPDRSTILASEIMLEEYPRVAPESPGDLFDGGEVDQLLTLNILGMTDEEKAEMRASDPRARAILERTEAMTAEDLMRLHGTFRNRAPVGQP